ncbi:MAG: flavocytochrome c [Desulfosarcinaceae bacterium]|jgi:flavocytochrome c
MSAIESGLCVNVVVIGGGFAGLAAGIEARLAGASVLLVEKMARPGGNSIISDGGMSAAGSSLQKAQGIHDSAELMYRDMLEAGQYLNIPALAGAVAENSVETLEWTRDFLGVKFKDRVDHFGGHSLARTHITQRVSGGDIIKPLVAKFQELGGQLRVKTLMRELSTDPHKGVVGVKLQSGFSLQKGGQGKTYPVVADRGVVMATGGFGADVDFRLVQAPRLGEKVDTTNKPSATAEGLKALLKIGAAPVHLSHIQLGPWCSPDERYYGAAPDFVCYVAQPYGIWVDMDTGRRFVNELSNRAIRANAILGLGKPALALADQTAVDKVGWDLTQALAKGVVRRFDSWAKLAGHYGVNRSALENSVSRYNEFQKQRLESDFGKPILAGSRPMEVPPFYAARIWPKVHYTMGGARIDAKTRVLDLDGQPIPGLFAAGEVTGGVHGACRLGGNAITECLYFGRVAGRLASTPSNLASLTFGEALDDQQPPPGLPA